MPEAEKARWSWPLAAVTLVAIGIVASVLVLNHYGGGSFWPGLVTGFIGTLVAFVLALAWERERERQRLTRDAADLQDGVQPKFAAALSLCARNSRRIARASRPSPRHSSASESTRRTHPRARGGRPRREAPGRHVRQSSAARGSVDSERSEAFRAHCELRADC